MTQLKFQYKCPVMKKKFYICQTHETVRYDIFDAVVKDIYKTNNGYVFTIFLNKADAEYFTNIDSIALKILLERSGEWFGNNLSESEIKELYSTTFCCQNNTLSLNANDKTVVRHNNKVIDIGDIIDKISDENYQKKHFISLKLQYMGLCIYQEYTNHRWDIKQIAIDDIDDIMIDSKETIEKFWEENVEESIKKLNNQIRVIEHKKEALLKLMNDVKQNKHTEKIWEAKIGEIQGLVQNIIF